MYIYIYMYMNMYVCMFVCLFVCMCVNMYVYIHTYISQSSWRLAAVKWLEPVHEARIWKSGSSAWADCYYRGATFPRKKGSPRICRLECSYWMSSYDVNRVLCKCTHCYKECVWELQSRNIWRDVFVRTTASRVLRVMLFSTVRAVPCLPLSCWLPRLCMHGWK